MGTITNNKFISQSPLLRTAAAVLFVASALFSVAYAAPHPGTGSSALVSPEKGLFLSVKGFRVAAENTVWILSLDKAENEELRFIDPQHKDASFSVKMDTIKTNLSLESYSKRWMRDYSSYGFDILGAKPFQQNGERGLVIDLVHRLSKKQMRQIVFMKERKAVVMTCTDEKDSFHETLSRCNQVIKTFEWVEPNQTNS